MNFIARMSREYSLAIEAENQEEAEEKAGDMSIENWSGDWSSIEVEEAS